MQWKSFVSSLFFLFPLHASDVFLTWQSRLCPRDCCRAPPPGLILTFIYFFLSFIFKARREISSELVRGLLSSYLHARASQWSDIQRGVRRGSWEEGSEQWRGVCSAERLFSGRLQRCEASSAAFAHKPLRINGRKTQMLPRICRQTSF